MKKVLRNYLFSILLLSGVAAGGVLGALLGGKVLAVKPLGDLFLNLLFTLVVPMVFFSTASSVCRLTASGRVGKVLGVLMLVLLAMYLIAGTLSYLVSLIWNPLSGVDASAMIQGAQASAEGAALSAGEAIVGTLTVNDFPLLFSKSHLLALIIFSALFGAGTALAGPRGTAVASLLDSGTAVIIKVLGMVMYLAPVCLGCYFACMVASTGPQIIGCYLKAFVEYLAIALVMFFIVNPLYVLAARGKAGVKAWFTHIWPPTLVSLSTASSSAALPSNIQAAKNMGVDEDIAESVVALGTNIHKDGSVISAVFKVTLALAIAGQGAATPLQAVGLAILAALVTGAVTSGNLMGELLICVMLGLDPHIVGVLTIFGTLIDMPSTVVNATGNTATALIVDRICQRRNNPTGHGDGNRA